MSPWIQHVKNFAKAKGMKYNEGGWVGWLRRDGWFAKVDNRFGYEKWLQGGSIGLDSFI